ncbi:PH domain-containing protein [Cronbergia sp. UHCC 0137]|uniref:PH domain-containing protein n=1 Tax=Cronbergia sp. UHCC 0137 TaxID=3110239 RepID=UPI002B1FE91E|nr:PH domain-containing protein [Cronbergia sp. UHCC 0137]MEA5618170.1 PH domain-containing protein [Cronbergia sp. UHCC 0137]
MGIREEVYYEGGPHIGDLILNLMIGLTVVGIPLAIGAIVRALWLRYRITDRRIAVMGGWLGRDRTDVIYSEVAKIVKVPRGIGIWGDMVVTMKNGNRIEMRAVPKFLEVYDYINERIIAKNPEFSTAKK